MKSIHDIQPEKVFLYSIFFILFMFILFSLVGCSVSRKTSRETEKTKDVDISQSTQNTVNTAQTVTKTTEKTTGNLTIPASSVKAAKPIENILKGDTMKSSDGNVSTSVYLDKNGNIEAVTTTNPRTIPVNNVKETETAKTEAQTSDNSKLDISAKETEKEAIKRDFKAKTSILPYGIAIAILLLVVYVFRKRIPFINKLVK